MYAKKIISLSLAASCILYAQDFVVNEGWNLLGTQQNITQLDIFDKGEIRNVWRLDTSWQIYPVTSGIESMSAILPNDGFWVNAKGDVNITISDVKEKQDIQITKEFQLLGATIDIDVTEFDKDALRSAWVLRNGAWSRYPHQSEYEALNTISKGEGFWLLGNSEANVTLTDAKSVRTQEMDIKSGWQLKGTQIDTDTLEAFNISEVESIWTFENNEYFAYPEGLTATTLTSLKCGQGFWVNSKSATTIDVNIKASENERRVKLLPGWQLLGAREDLNTKNIFNVEDVKVIYVYRDGVYKTFKYNDQTSDLSVIRKGEGYWLNSGTDKVLANLIEINGSVVDGYIKDARLSVASFESGKTLPIISNRTNLSAPLFSLTSGTKGGFNFFIENSGQNSGFYINSSEGFDRSTGENFEGKMQALITPSSLNYTFNTTITPITTLVSQMTKKSILTKGLRNSSLETVIEQAKTSLAQKMGISKDTLDKDPIVLLQSGNDTQKREAAKLLKNIMVVQKNVELLSKSVVEKSNNDRFTKVNDAVFQALATNFSKESTTTFEDVMKDTTTIITNVSSQLSSVEGVTNAQEKLNALKDVIKSTTNSTLRIKEDTIVSSSDSASILQQIEAIQKSVEIVTSKVEAKAELVAKATASFDTVAKDATDTLKAIAFSGGIEGVKNLVKKQIDTYALQGKTVDASSYADLVLSDTKIAQQKKSFETIFGTELNIDLIEAATASFEEIVQKQSKGEVVDAALIASVIGTKVAEFGINQETINQITIAVAAEAETIISEIVTLVTESETLAEQTLVASLEESTSSVSTTAPDLPDSSSSSSLTSSSSSSIDPSLIAPAIP